MNRSHVVDRLLVALVGLALVAGGLLAVDWQQGWVLDLPSTLTTGPAQDVVTASWWPWASAVATVCAALLGLVLLTRLVPGRGPSTLRSSVSDERGRVEVDVRSLADAAARRLAELGPVDDPSGRVVVRRGRTGIELHARVAADADIDQLLLAVRQCTAEVEEAFPHDPVACRVVLDAPREGRGGRARGERRDRVRIREGAERPSGSGTDAERPGVPTGV